MKQYIPTGNVNARNLIEGVLGISPPEDFADTMERAVLNLGGEVIIKKEDNKRGQIGYYLTQRSTVLLMDPHRAYKEGITLFGSSHKEINKTRSKLERETGITFLELKQT